MQWFVSIHIIFSGFFFYFICRGVSDDVFFSKVIYSHEGRRSIMTLSHRMVKNLCANLGMKNKLDIPHLPEKKNIEIRFSVFTSTVGGQTDGLIVNAATSIWLPLSCPSVFEFLRDEKMRAQVRKHSNYFFLLNVTYTAHRKCHPWWPLTSWTPFIVYQWDILAKGISFQEIAKMSYGDHTGNRISIIQVS